MATQYEGDGTFLANSALSAHRGVTISSNRGVGNSATANIPDGFTRYDIASGDYVAVKFFAAGGTHKCEVTGTPVTVGDTLYAGAAGRVTPVGTVTVGKSLSTSATNGSVIEFLATS